MLAGYGEGREEGKDKHVKIIFNRTIYAIGLYINKIIIRC